MPWVRIDEHALNHVKILALSNAAFRLWVEGLAHCQKHLTDGAISRAALKSFRYASRSRIDELTESVDGHAPLWGVVTDGFMVHDYLAWNESREHVLKAREFAKNRIQKLRDKKRVGNAIGNGDRNALHADVVTVSPTSGVECTGSSALEGESVRGDRRRPEPQSPSDRAGAFCEWYADTHERLFGVAYIGTNSDYIAALRLIEKVSDTDLRDAALVWFGHDDEFATKGTRSVAKFASRASGCLQTARAVVGRSA
jgi:hypothetical protein